MEMALKKVLVSISSAQFFENQNAWNTTLVSYGPVPPHTEFEVDSPDLL